MWRGTVVTIHVARAAGEPMIERDRVWAIAGRGLEGDRYFEGSGFYSDHPGPIREVSLIEEETLEALRRDHSLALAPGVTRRNITTRGVPLNHLVGRDFRVGGATLRGVELCEPCRHLVDVTGIKSLLPTLVHRGGLHAEVVGDGTISAGDEIEEVYSDSLNRPRSPARGKVRITPSAAPPDTAGKAIAYATPDAPPAQWPPP